MNSDDHEILRDIQEIIKRILPAVKITLFGSRASNTATDESDWDILILTQEKYPKQTRWEIQDSLLPLSLKIAAYIDITMVREEDWNNDPGYYSLKLDMAKQKSIVL